jgi:hypothetical protein
MEAVYELLVSGLGHDLDEGNCLFERVIRLLHQAGLVVTGLVFWYQQLKSQAINQDLLYLVQDGVD